MGLFIKLFPRLEPNVLYAKFYLDKIEIKNLTTGKSSSRASSTPFSHDDNLLNDFEIGEQTLRKAIKDVASHPNKALQPRFSIVVHPMVDDSRELNDLEKNKLVDVGKFTGGTLSLIHRGPKSLSDNEVLDLLEIEN